MNRFERWFLRRIFRKAVMLGYNPGENITALYVMIREAAGEEFNEDNTPTLDNYLIERFRESL